MMDSEIRTIYSLENYFLVIKVFYYTFPCSILPRNFSHCVALYPLDRCGHQIDEVDGVIILTYSLFLFVMNSFGVASVVKTTIREPTVTLRSHIIPINLMVLSLLLSFTELYRIVFNQTQKKIPHSWTIVLYETLFLGGSIASSNILVLISFDRYLASSITLSISSHYRRRRNVIIYVLVTINWILYISIVFIPLAHNCLDSCYCAKVDAISRDLQVSGIFYDFDDIIGLIRYCFGKSCANTYKPLYEMVPLFYVTNSLICILLTAGIYLKLVLRLRKVSKVRREQLGVCVASIESNKNHNLEQERNPANHIMISVALLFAFQIPLSLKILYGTATGEMTQIKARSILEAMVILSLSIDPLIFTFTVSTYRINAIRDFFKLFDMAANVPVVVSDSILTISPIRLHDWH